MMAANNTIKANDASTIAFLTDSMEEKCGKQANEIMWIKDCLNNAIDRAIKEGDNVE